MEYHQVFLQVVLKEIERFNLDTEVYSTYVNQLTASFDENFTNPYNTCAFMYKYATCCTYLFQECLKQFLLEYSNAKDIISEWKSYSEVCICSLSVGPGLDYLAFMLAILEYDSAPPNFNGATVITKHGAWRNSVNFMLEILRKQGSVFEVPWPKLKYDKVNVIQADLVKSFSEKGTLVSVGTAHVVLMMNTLNLLAPGTAQERSLLQMLKGLIASLRSNATIFCIDTKPSLDLLIQALSNFPGKFLYGPINQAVRIPVDFPKVNECRPLASASGSFFVWQKLPSSSSMTSLISSPVNITPVSTECKEDNSAACNSSDDAKSSSSSSFSSGDETKAEDSDNLPWIELKTFWKTSSPTTKKILKQLMLSNDDSLEQICDFISQSGKVDKAKKLPLNITQQEKLEVQTSSISHALTFVHNIKNIIDDCSKLQNTVGIKEINKPELSHSYKQPNSFHTPVEIDCINLGVNYDEANIIKDDIAIPSCESKVIQTGTLEKIPTISPTVKALIGRIKKLASSFENAIQQNEPPNCTGDYVNMSFNNCCNQQKHFASSTGNLDNVGLCSEHLPNYCSTEEDGLPSYESSAQKNDCLQCSCSHCKCQCCHKQCNIMQIPCCHFQPCHLKQRCNFSCNRLPKREDFENIASPSIVIPLQHISEDALLQITSILKSGSKSN